MLSKPTLKAAQFYFFLLLCFSVYLPRAIGHSLMANGFEENRGQIVDEEGNLRPDVFFVARFPGVNLFFTDKGVVYHFYKIEPAEFDSILAGKKENPYSYEEWESIMLLHSNGEYAGNGFRAKGKFYRVDMTIPGAELKTAIGEEALLQRNHFYSPNHPDGLRDIPVFQKIRYQNVYPGIDLVFYTKEGRLKYDFEVAAHAQPERIRILYRGHQGISLDENGNAVVRILPGKVVENAPLSFQMGKEIETAFQLAGDTLQFRLASYDPTKSITIDPALTWATYFHEGTTSAAFTYTRPVWDSQGNMFIAFDTYNRTVFPLVNPGGGAYYNSTAGATGLQLIIMKFNPSRQIVWATYYASSQASRTNFSNQCLAVDQNDAIYVVGEVSFVYGNNPPYTIAFPLFNPGGGAYYETQLGNSRNFILKFSSAGERLWATMFNKTVVNTSSSGLSLTGITIDNNNRLMISGQTYTPTSWQPIPLVDPGGSHYYRATASESRVPTLHRFTSSGVLEWSTYISQGVANSYNANVNASITMDASNNIFIASDAGQVFNGGSPTPYTLVNPGGGAYQDNGNTNTNNGRKISIFKFNNNGALFWCTLYGGNNSANAVIWQDIRDLKVASNGDLFLAGRSNTTNFPTYDPGGGAYMKTTLSTGSTAVHDGVILQFSNNGVRKWATYYGGNGTSDGTDFWGMGIDGSDNVFVSGISRSPSFPAQSKTGSYNQSTISSDYAIVFAQFNPNGVRQWASYFGNQTFSSTGGFGLKPGACAGSKITQFGTVNNTHSITTTDPGGGAYFESSKEGTTGQTDIIVELEDSGGIGGGGVPGVWGWTGAVNTDWFEPCNWDKTSVPTATSPVVIPGAPPNQPTIANGTGHCLQIEVQSSSGAELTIRGDLSGALEVHQ